MPDITLTLQREPGTDEGTFGRLTGQGLDLHSLELPWRDNEKSRSCIPTGLYRCRLTHSTRFKRDLYEVTAVPGRGNILIHNGNTAGDTKKGHTSDVEGCILLGLRRGALNGQRAVLDSKKALQIFMDSMKGREFMLDIQA